MLKLFWRFDPAELKDLAQESLDLLRRAIFDERFPALFELGVYGNIIGMFELNNLGETMVLHCLHSNGQTLLWLACNMLLPVLASLQCSKLFVPLSKIKRSA